MNLSIGLSMVNVLLLISLVYVYGKNAIKIRSMFTFGLLTFALLFFVHNTLYLYFALTMMPYYADSAQLYGFIFNLIQTLAFVVLNIVTWK